MRIFLLFFLAFFPLFAFETQFKTFKSEFTQLVSSMNSKITYKGSFYLTPNEAFWSYESPANKQIYIKNKEVVIVEEDLEQVIISKLNKIPNLSTIFKNAKKKSENKYETVYDGVLYDISLENGEVNTVTYKDEFDNVVTISLFNQERNIPLNSNIFNAKFPPHYDVVR